MVKTSGFEAKGPAFDPDLSLLIFWIEDLSYSCLKAWRLALEAVSLSLNVPLLAVKLTPCESKK